MRLFPRFSTGSRRIRVLIFVLIVLILVIAFSGIWRSGPNENFDVFLPTRTPTQSPAPNTPKPTPESTQQPTPVPKPEKFSIIWLADTQTIAYHQQNDVFQAMGEWIMENEEPLNIRYIVQTGDLVDNGFQKKQWASFDVLLKQFYGKIPYLPVAGNHDLGVKWENYRAYLEQPFVRDLPKDHVFNRGRGVYAEFQAGGVNFLLIGAGWNAEASCENWINNVLRAHPDDIAILLFHSYINVKGNLSHQGISLHNLVAKNPNVRLILSGHLRGNGFRAEEFDDNFDGKADRTVNAMLYNYQGYDHTNSGQLRVLQFDTATRTIHVYTYSPYTQDYYRDEYFKAREFDLVNAF